MIKNIQPIEFLPNMPALYGLGLTDNEILSRIAKKVNECITSTNSLSDIITTIQSDLNKLNDNIANEVVTQLNEWYNNGYLATLINDTVTNKKMIFVGDSYILGYSATGTIYNSYANILKNALNLDVEILGTSGAGFCSIGQGAGEGKNFLATLQTYQGEKTAVTDIYVFGGYNDRTFTTTEIWTAMENFKNYVKANYPNAKMHLAYIGWSLFPSEYELIARSVKAYCRGGIYEFEYMTNSEYILHNPAYFSPDKFHPNQEGHDTLASYLGSAILGGEIDVNEVRSEINVPPFQNSTKLSNVFMAQHNNMISISMPDSSTVSLEQFDGNYWGVNWIQISDVMNNSFVRGFWDSYWTGSVAWQPIDNEVWYSAPASLKIVDGKWFLQIQAILPNTAGLYNGKIRQVLIPAFTMQCPALMS